MARPKKKTTTATRSRRKAACSKSSGSSVSSIFALAAILGLGGVSIWAVSQKESPQTALANLWTGAKQSNLSTLTSTTTKPANTAPQDITRNTNRNNQATAQATARTTTLAPAPAIKRPSAPVIASKPVRNDEQQLAAIAPLPRPTTALEKILPANKPQGAGQPALSASQSRSAKQPPVGKNMIDSAPRPVFARVALSIHKNAWDRSAVQGTVKKGHEMRSYGQTGKWHRVVVPGTDVIGWVHEDQLIVAKAPANKNINGSVSDIITGSISASKQKANNVVSAPVPPASVSQRLAQ